MNILVAIILISSFTYLLIQFARQEVIEGYYQATIVDIEGRLDWADTRSSCPFGMQARLDIASKLLHKAKKLWCGNKFGQAYRVAKQSQKQIDKAQNIYISDSIKRGQSIDIRNVQ